MKNLQKGFIIPVLLVIIGLLVVGGGVYVYKNKKIEAPVVDTETQQSKQVQQTNTQTPPVTTSQTTSNKTYRHPSGLYNISHPSNWIVSEIKEGVVFSDLGKIEPIGYTSNYTSLDHEFRIYLVDKDPSIEAKNRAKYSGYRYSDRYIEENIKISGIDAKRTIHKETKNASYVIPLNNNKFIAISVVARNGSDEWLSQGYKATQTMIIDQSKSTTAKTQKDRAKDDLALRNLIENTHPSAEMYRDSHSNYAGFCMTKEEPTHRTLAEIKEKLGSQPFRCSDGDLYAVSAKLYSGEYYCADSTNFSGVIYSLHISNSCK